VIVTVLPPAGGPAAGESNVIAGTAAYVNSAPATIALVLKGIIIPIALHRVVIRLGIHRTIETVGSIGLNLAKRFAEMHGGSISVSSDGLGRGAEFMLSLPVVVDAGEAPAPAPPAALPQHAAATRKILVVDDNVDAADTLEALLSIEGFSVAVAYDGEAALEAVRNDPPSIVLMDIGMPRMDGYEAARRIREETEGIRLIALTGWGQDLDRQKAQEAGFNTHFVKPVDLEQLLSTINE